MTKHISKNELLEIIDKNICGDESTAERRAGKILNGINCYKKEKTFREKENESLKKEVACLKGKYNRCRNELCLRCGRYKKSHLGACDGCVYKESDTEMAECCGTCKWHRHEDIDDGWVCVNDRSEYCADWTECNDWCEEWEKRSDNKEVVIKTDCGLLDL